MGSLLDCIYVIPSNYTQQTWSVLSNSRKMPTTGTRDRLLL